MIAEEVPDAARGPAIDPAQGYLIEELRGGAYCVSDGDYQALVVASRDGTVLVDAPPSLAPHLPAALAEVAGAPVTHVIYSHSHYDHIGAAHLFGDATSSARPRSPAPCGDGTIHGAPSQMSRSRTA